MPPNNIKSEFDSVSTGLACGGPPNAAAIAIAETAMSEQGRAGDAVKYNRDGQPAKRRGPKPDSKPAMTRRQEMNRHAQRTHRQRKEAYLKSMEGDLNRLKTEYATVVLQRSKLQAENNQLKMMLQQNAMDFSPTPPATLEGSLHNASGSNGNYLASSPVSNSNSYALSAAPHVSPYQSAPYTPSASGNVPGTMPQGLSPSGVSPIYSMAMSGGPSPTDCFPATQQDVQMQQGGRMDYDYEMEGTNFVLNLERPCMEHMPFLLERSFAPGGIEPSGHALMASCPPQPFPTLTPDIPFGTKFLNNAPAPLLLTESASNNTLVPQKSSTRGSGSLGLTIPPGPNMVDNNTAMAVDGPPPLQTWELAKGDLSTLLDLSRKLPTDRDGEITPIGAWNLIMAHPRLRELDEADFKELADVLKTKIRCYGFGAVLEEFELRDALAAVFSRKMEIPIEVFTQMGL